MISRAEVSSNANRYVVKISSPRPGTLPFQFAPPAASPTGVTSVNARPTAPDQQHREPDAEQQRRDPLAAQHLDHGVRAVAADEHQHEQEQHHHGARVDDDLHEAEEQRPLGHVEHAQREHRAGQAQRRVHGVAGEHHAQRAGERDRAEDPERHRLAAPARRHRAGTPGEARRHRLLAALGRQFTTRCDIDSLACCSALPRALGRRSRTRGRRRSLARSRTAPHRSRRGAPGRLHVVVLLGLAEPHRVRRLLHARQQRGEQLLLGEDQVLPVVVGQLVEVASSSASGSGRPRRTGRSRCTGGS